MVTLYGTGFGNGATVTFGGVSATNVVVVSQHTITCTPPAHAAGAVNVVVTNADSTTSTLVNGYLYVAPAWFTLDHVPAALVADAQTLTLDEFILEWSDLIGPDFVSWIYTYFSSFRINFPAQIPLHWYIYTFPSPGTLWTSSSEPSPNGWFQSTDNFASEAQLIVASVPHNPRSFTEIAGFASGSAGMLGGSPGVGVGFRNHLIYASGGYTVGTDSPSLRIFDGLSDRQITSLPNTSAGVVPKAIVAMILVGDLIYLSTYDSGTTDADFAGRVLSFNPLTGEMAQIGTDFTGGEIPYALCWHMNRLWIGTNQASAATGKIYYFRPGIDQAWTTDYTLSTSSVGGCCSLASFQGKLYVGTDNVDANFAKVLVRSSLGAYTTSDTGAGGTAKANNGFLSLYEFQSKLYASYWNPDTTAIAKIRVFDGSSWTTAYSGSGGTLRPYIGLFSVNNTLIVIGGGNTLSAVILTSPDGVTFTNRTSSLPGTSTASSVFGRVIL